METFLLILLILCGLILLGVMIGGVCFCIAGRDLSDDHPEDYYTREEQGY